jgi:hypothetical protein
MESTGGYISSYRTSRQTIAILLGIFVEVIPVDQVKRILDVILRASKSDAEDGKSKDALDTLCCLAEVLLVKGRNIANSYAVLPDILSALLRGSGNAHLETAKTCHNACLLIAQGIKACLCLPEDGVISESSVIKVLKGEMYDTSWHVRETVMMCLSGFMVGNWTSLSLDDRKICKEVFTQGFLDLKPEIQQLARVGLIAYLSHKTPTELKSFAEAYCRNSDKFLLLEKRRKKEGNGDASSDKVDQKLTTTVMMMSCLVLCFPYDMPSFMPQLVCSLVRHKASHSLKDTVSQTVLEFKRTHQDRWEEFKTYFSADQLDSLINASHVSYCN